MQGDDYKWKWLMAGVIIGAFGVWACSPSKHDFDKLQEAIHKLQEATSQMLKGHYRSIIQVL